MIIGGLLSSISLVTSAFVNPFWALLVTAGILAGCGFGLVFISAISAVNMYFSKHRVLAQAISLSGNGCGSFLWPMLHQFFIKEYGCRGALWVAGGVVLNACACGVLVWFQDRNRTRNTKQFVPTYEIEIQDRSNISKQEMEQEPEIRLADTNKATSRIYLEEASKIKLQDESNISSIQPLEHEPKIWLQDSKKNSNTELEQASTLMQKDNTTCNFKTNSFSINDLLVSKNGNNTMEDCNKEVLQEYISITTHLSPHPQDYGTEVNRNGNLIQEYQVNCHIGVGSNNDTEQESIQPFIEKLDIETESTNNMGLEKVKLNKSCFKCKYIEMLFEFKYVIMSLSTILYVFGISITFSHLVAFAQSCGHSEYNSATILSTFGISGLFGRLLLGALANLKQMDVILLFIISYLLAGISILINSWWMQLEGFFICASVYGFFHGGAYGPLFSEVTSIISGTFNFPVAYGCLCVYAGVGSFVGSPAAGFVYDKTRFYPASYMLGGSCVILSGFIMLAAWWPMRRRKQTTEYLQE